MKIIHADKLAENLKIFKRVMQSQGHVVLSSQTALNVLEILKKDKEIELVIIDYDLVGPISGPDLLKIIMAEFPEMKWLATSSSYWPGHANKNRILSKPFTGDVLIYFIEKVQKGLN